MKNLGFYFLVLVAIIFFNLHLVSSTTEKALKQEQNDVKDNLMEKLSSRNVSKHRGGGGLHGFHNGSGSDRVLNQEQNDVKDITPPTEKLFSRVVIRRGGGRGGGGGHGGGGRGGGGGSKGRGRSPGTRIPIIGGAAGAGHYHHNNRNGAQNKGRPTALVMLHAWILLCGIHFFFNI